MGQVVEINPWTRALVNMIEAWPELAPLRGHDIGQIREALAIHLGLALPPTATAETSAQMLVAATCNLFAWDINDYAPHSGPQGAGAARVLPSRSSHG